MDDAGGCFEIVVLPPDRGGGPSEAGLAGQVGTFLLWLWLFLVCCSTVFVLLLVCCSTAFVLLFGCFLTAASTDQDRITLGVALTHAFFSVFFECHDHFMTTSRPLHDHFTTTSRPLHGHFSLGAHQVRAGEQVRAVVGKVVHVRGGRKGTKATVQSVFERKQPRRWESQKHAETETTTKENKSLGH
jgi:hypothetical protein